MQCLPLLFLVVLEKFQEQACLGLHLQQTLIWMGGIYRLKPIHPIFKREEGLLHTPNCPVWCSEVSESPTASAFSGHPIAYCALDFSLLLFNSITDHLIGRCYWPVTELFSHPFFVFIWPVLLCVKDWILSRSLIFSCHCFFFVWVACANITMKTANWFHRWYPWSTRSRQILHS